jgi:serine/threonine protein kinase
MNFLTIPQCAMGVAKCFTPSVNAIPIVKKTDSDRNAVFDAPTTDTLPDFSYESDSDDDADDIAARMLEDAAIVEAWEPEVFEMVKTLQSAPANKGCVDLMKSLDHGGRFVAVKKMPTSWVTASPKEFARMHPDSNERPWVDIATVKYLHEKRFVNICEPLGVFSDECHTYVINDFATRGELFGMLDCGPTPGLEREVMFRPIMKQLFAAVKQLHNLGIAHRDISLENILLSEDGNGITVKLIDFGMATTERYAYQPSGKRSYIAPEMQQDAPYDVFLSDAFALGVTLFSVACQEYPWNSTAPGACKLFSYISKHGLQQFLERRKVYKRQEKLAEVLTRPLADLLIGLLQVDPEERLSLGEKCWCDEDTQPRKSVWDEQWLEMED